MHTSSLPPTDRDETPAPFPCDTGLRSKLREMRDTGKWSNNRIASRLGFSVAVISQYLNDDGNKYPGDIAALERRIVDWLKNESRRRASGVDTIPTEVTREIAAAFEYVRKTGAVGAIYAESGEGKTRAIELYLRDNPTAILFHVRSWCRDLGSIESGVFESVGSSGYNRKTKRAVYLVNKLCGSDRLIIVDDAHKLTRPALQWLFDFHDETGCPLAFVGTCALILTLDDDDQRSSRTGISWLVTSQKRSPLITQMVNALVPDANGESVLLAALCEEAAEKHGHYRNVHQQLKLAVEFHEAKPTLTWRQAWDAAATRMPSRQAPRKPRS